MKKLSVFALALLLFTLGVNTVAAQLNEDAFPVKIRLLEYAYLEVPEILDIGEVDFYGGFERFEVWTNIKLYTNTDVLIRFESAGFDFEGEESIPLDTCTNCSIILIRTSPLLPVAGAADGIPMIHCSTGPAM